MAFVVYLFRLGLTVSSSGGACPTGLPSTGSTGGGEDDDGVVGSIVGTC